MLILTRKRNDSIRIGEDIVVRVMRTAKGSVKIGIEAPDSVRIVRGELNDTGDFVSAPAIADIHEECNADALMLQH
ncbi:MAG: carbon storage regulator [Planctomycetes bacterium]|nr:carbon storage regulator [Planctomycetota bacterium]